MALDSMPAWYLSRHPEEAAKITAEQEAARAAIRRETVAALAEFDAAWPGILKDFEQKYDKAVAAQKAADAAAVESNRALAARTNASNRRERALSAGLRKLREEFPDEQIESFLAKVQAEIDAHRQRGYDRMEGRLWDGRAGHYINVAVLNKSAYTARQSALVELVNRVTDLSRSDSFYLSDDPEADMDAAWRALPKSDKVWDDPKLAKAIAEPVSVAAEVSAALAAVI